MPWPVADGLGAAADVDSSKVVPARAEINNPAKPNILMCFMMSPLSGVSERKDRSDSGLTPSQITVAVCCTASIVLIRLT